MSRPITSILLSPLFDAIDSFLQIIPLVSFPTDTYTHPPTYLPTAGLQLLGREPLLLLLPAPTDPPEQLAFIGHFQRGPPGFFRGRRRFQWRFEFEFKQAVDGGRSTEYDDDDEVTYYIICAFCYFVEGAVGFVYQCLGR